MIRHRQTSRSGVRQHLDSQAGSSPVTAIGSLLIFLGFLFLAVQVAVHLYASSTVGGVALEAANRAAQSGAPTAACPQVEDWAEGQLRGVGAVTTCVAQSTTVVVRVSATSPAASLRLLGAMAGLDTIQRSAEVRVEVFDAQP